MVQKPVAINTTSTYLNDQYENIYKRSNLTKLQFLYWVGQKLRPEVPLFNNIFTFTILGEINREHFQKAFQILVDHSDALRTVIKEIDGVPQQKVKSNFFRTLEHIDFSQYSKPYETFQAWLRRRRTVSFDFETCLFDSVLVKISPDYFVWYLNQHHIISDVTSFFLIYQHMSELYDSSLKGKLREPLVLPSFQDYVDLERRYRTSPRQLESESYLEKKLVESIEPTSFYGKNLTKKQPWLKGCLMTWVSSGQEG